MRFEPIRDLRMVRAGWRWGGVRPATWPEATPGLPEPSTNLDWARQEPIRSLRWLLQRGLSVPFTRAVTGLHVEGAGWLEDQDRPALLCPTTSATRTPWCSSPPCPTTLASGP